MREQKENMTKRNIGLNINTYQRLEKYKIELIKKKGDLKITFDDVINDLLDRSTESKMS